MQVDSAGPRILSASPSGNATAPFDDVTVNFDAPIDSATFTADDVRITFAGSDVLIAGITVQSDTQYTIQFAPQTAPGSYALSVGPDIEDLAANKMDQGLVSFPDRLTVKGRLLRVRSGHAEVEVQ
jgi:hypothetical protein